ncbi:Aldehyde dehydrogenase [hydrothermal vent metagenome]|uniref:Aldehyde dehydrogenase n=1 Tax=hydrothermal vent metagenome TaxID=652676 RepID=A0A3B0TSI8_9ZZZZ
MAAKSRQEWSELAKTLQFRAQAFIDGEFVDAESGNTFATISPIDGRHLADIARCEAEDVDKAVKSARAAFDDRRWRGQDPAARKKVLQNLAQLIASHQDELALLETLDMGKPIADSLSIDIPATANCFDWHGEAIDKIYDEIAPTPDSAIALVRREPLGVVGAVVPWNFPLLMASWKLAPALACGNSVILKPAEQSSLSALLLAELALEAGIPPGVLNVVTGGGPTAGRALGLHMDVDGLFFTGSTRVGKIFMQYSAQSNLKKLGLELGGKSPNIILASYKDTKHAAKTSAGSAFFNQGEMCTCPSRLIVEKSIHEEVVETLLEEAKNFIPGDPLDPKTTMGALVDNNHADRVMGFVKSAIDEGATIATGGKRARAESGGCYVEPTVFDNVNNDMVVARQEIFGPMVSVIPVENANEAVRVANDTNYGLAAAVWTDDLATAHTMSRDIRAGMVYVNCYDCDDMTVPFGGFKQSGFGRDKSLHALDKYTELKTTWINIGK